MFKNGVFNRALSLLLVGAMLLTMPACNTTSKIIVEPEGAEVSIDGMFLGKAPDTLYASRSGLPDQAYVNIELEGYEPVKNGLIKKSYRADLSLLLLILCFIPYFFSARYEDEYRFQLRAKKDKAPKNDKGEAAAPAGSTESPPKTSGN